MVANPIQKQKRVSLLLGLIIGLVIGLILCIVLYMFLTSNIGNKMINGDNLKQVAVLKKSIQSGDQINSSDIELKNVSSDLIPTDAVSGFKTETVAKVNLSAGTILSESVLTTQDSKLTKDLRQQEYNMIVLPSQLSTGDFIDIRLELPDGTDYIVIPKKCVQNANATTVWLNMNEEEILTMSNAIVEYYIMTGSKLYANKYTEPGAQSAATPTYVPNSSVADLIKSELKNDNNPNGNIETITEGRYTDALKNLRNNKIRTILNRYDTDKQLENIETKIQEEIKNLKESRQSYFGVLDTAE